MGRREYKKPHSCILLYTNHVKLCLMLFAYHRFPKKINIAFYNLFISCEGLAIWRGWYDQIGSVYLFIYFFDFSPGEINSHLNIYKTGKWPEPVFIYHGLVGHVAILLWRQWTKHLFGIVYLSWLGSASCYFVVKIMDKASLSLCNELMAFQIEKWDISDWTTFFF
jgi:hypothetical protein